MKSNTVESQDSASPDLHPSSKPQRRSRNKIKELDAKIQEKLKQLQTTRSGRHCYPLLLHNTSIGMQVVDDV